MGDLMPDPKLKNQIIKLFQENIYVRIIVEPHECPLEEVDTSE